MNKLHTVVQGKGGVGKSLVAALLAQYYKQNGNEVLCADTDPVNATFTQYRALDVAQVEISENGNVVQRKFDPLMEAILSTDKDTVVDNGASTFLPLTRYIHENEIFKIMSEAGKKVFVHTILTGGQAKQDTFNGFAELVSKVDGNAKIVVWENEFWGKVQYDEGAQITETKLFKEALKAGKIAGVVKIIERQSDTFQGDMKQMTENHLTLSEVQESKDFSFLSKIRIHKIVHDVFSQLQKINWE